MTCREALRWLRLSSILGKTFESLLIAHRHSYRLTRRCYCLLLATVQFAVVNLSTTLIMGNSSAFWNSSSGLAVDTWRVVRETGMDGKPRLLASDGCISLVITPNTTCLVWSYCLQVFVHSELTDLPPPDLYLLVDTWPRPGPGGYVSLTSEHFPTKTVFVLGAKVRDPLYSRLRCIL